MLWAYRIIRHILPAGKREEMRRFSLYLLLERT
jgi:hypothetical protein